MQGERSLSPGQAASGAAQRQDRPQFVQARPENSCCESLLDDELRDVFPCERQRTRYAGLWALFDYLPDAFDVVVIPMSDDYETDRVRRAHAYAVQVAEGRWLASLRVEAGVDEYPLAVNVDADGLPEAAPEYGDLKLIGGRRA